MGHLTSFATFFYYSGICYIYYQLMDLMWIFVFLKPNRSDEKCMRGERAVCDGKFELIVKSFGGFSVAACSDGTREPLGPSVPDGESHARKIWALVKYLVCSQRSRVSADELIEVLWPQDGSAADPVRSLRLLVHRARQELDKLGCVTGDQLILCHGGAYSWNRTIPMESDMELFENYYRFSRSGSDEQRLSRLRSAIDLYKGPFLPQDSSSEWVMALDTYFHSRYTAMCLEAIEILRRADRPWDIVDVSSGAIVRDPYIEDFHIAMIEALAKVGAVKSAKEHYEKAMELYRREADLQPSPRLAASYYATLKNENKPGRDVFSIRKSLEDEKEGGAFYCEYELFRKIYSLKRRESLRIHSEIQMVLMTMVPSGGHTFRPADAAMEKMSETIAGTLRKGDIFTRFNSTQFLLLLQFTTAEKGKLAIERIQKRFQRLMPRSRYLLQYTLLPLPSEELAEKVGASVSKAPEMERVPTEHGR